MLEPYIIKRDTFLLVGQRVTLGGSNPSAEGIDWLWENSERIWNDIQNKAENQLYGVSLDFQYGFERGEDARHAYLLAAEVTKVERMAFDHESLVVPASEWLYIPIRSDDESVKSLAPEGLRDDLGYLAGCVFGWSNQWCSDNGYQPQGWPIGLEIMGLSRGYEDVGGPHETVCVPVRKLTD
ncbi:MAG: hypothetical protein LBU61_04305 [Coriobacteriales bacterium]|jgi:predicted transcriptional regulator YdeE|nr:hypothetical protein [Coriobacteriales bacterium]